MSEKKVENKKTFEVEVNGEKKNYAVLRPSHEVQQKGQLVYNRAFRLAVRPEDGQPGAIVRAALEGVLREQKLWDDNRQAEFENIQKALFEGERKLAKGGIKLTEARAIALQMRRNRWELRKLLADRNALDLNTADAQAEQARFNYFVVACTVHADTGKPYWQNEADYLSNPDDPVGQKAPQVLANLVFGLDEDAEKKLPENKWLLAYGFINQEMHLVDKRGRLVDAEGRLVDKDGRFINEQNEFIDREGNLLTAEGEYKVEFTPFLDDEGKPLSAPVSSGV